MTTNKKYESTTMAIRNVGFSDNQQVYASK